MTNDFADSFQQDLESPKVRRMFQNLFGDNYEEVCYEHLRSNEKMDGIYGTFTIFTNLGVLTDIAKLDLENLYTIIEEILEQHRFTFTYPEDTAPDDYEEEFDQVFYDVQAHAERLIKFVRKTIKEKISRQVRDVKRLERALQKEAPKQIVSGPKILIDEHILLKASNVGIFNNKESIKELRKIHKNKTLAIVNHWVIPETEQTA